MKKSLFKVLCMVLIIALLAPNAFAATPTPEAPLADAATVERVKQEIANGEITDMEDLFLVAYQHLGADLKEEGMTAYINEDGTLGITQILNSEKKMTRSGEVEEKSFVVMSLGAFDVNANLLSDYSYSTVPFYASDSDDAGIVRVTHAMYITMGEHESYGVVEVQLNRIATTIVHTQTGYVSSELVQAYTIFPDFVYPSAQGSHTTHWPASGTHTYYPGDTGSYNPSSGTPGGFLNTASTLTVTNINQPIHIDLTMYFTDMEGLI